MSPSVLAAVGAAECVYGAWVMLFPAATLTLAVGRLLSVDAAVASPALEPTHAQTGALRLALGAVTVASAMTTGAAKNCHTVETALVAHACLLQPFTAAFRSHTRMPVRNALLLALAEGAVLIVGMAAEADFDPDALSASYTFLASAAFLALGLIFALMACCKASSSPGAKPGDGLLPMSGSGGATPLLLDENRFQLSPASKRLLA